MFVLGLAKLLVEILLLTDGACDAGNDDDRYECQKVNHAALRLQVPQKAMSSIY